MTLADFARQNGIDPATARQWKRRGRIVERDGTFALADRRNVTDEEFQASRYPVTLSRFVAPAVTGRDVTEIGRLRDTVTAQRDEINALRLEIDAMNERLRRLEECAFAPAGRSVAVRGDWGA